MNINSNMYRIIQFPYALQTFIVYHYLCLLYTTLQQTERTNRIQYSTTGCFPLQSFVTSSFFLPLIFLTSDDGVLLNDVDDVISFTNVAG